MDSIRCRDIQQSLLAAFDNICQKYGNEYPSDDEIDLQTLKVVKPGKHLDKLPKLHFGSMYRKKKDTIEEDTVFEVAKNLNTFDSVLLELISRERILMNSTCTNCFDCTLINLLNT